MRAWSSDTEIVRLRRSSMRCPITAHRAGRARAAGPRPPHALRTPPDLSQLDRHL
jgi:hypothetical protein